MIDPNQPPTGSLVVNAATCTRDQIERWCDIYLVATEDTQVHEAVVAQLSVALQSADRQTLESMLLAILRQYMESQKESGSPDVDRISGYEDVVLSRVSESWEVLLSCVAAFFKGDVMAEEGDGVFCYVGSESRWLTISFYVENGTFSYLFAPPR